MIWSKKVMLSANSIDLNRDIKNIPIFQKKKSVENIAADYSLTLALHTG